MPQKKKENDLYALKRKLLKEKRVLRAKIMGVDTVDGNTGQRNYNEGTKTRRALKIEMFGSKSKSSKYGDDTSVETFIYDFLNEKNIAFIPQKAIRYINTDAYLPEYNVAIETNGDFWHCNPRVYPDGPKNNIQRKNIEKDKISKEIILGQGIHRIEIWEKDIKERPEIVKVKLLYVLDEIKNAKLEHVLSVSSGDW